MFLQQAWRSLVFGVYGFTQFTKAGFREHSKKFQTEDMRIGMEGKNCVVTGANSGIGFAAAEGLASRFHVYIVRGANVYMICDLSSISEVKSFASRFCSEKKQLHVLVNNAGLLEHNRTTTPEGLELNFAVNVAATYVMTELMLPLLEKAAPDSRVITVSSGGMYTVPLTRDLQVALTEKWAQIYHDKGVGFYSMHPGWAETPGVAKSLPSFHEKFSGKLRSSEEGADTIVWLALQPKEKLILMEIRFDSNLTRVSQRVNKSTRQSTGQMGAFYFDRFEAPKHLAFAGTAGSHSAIDAILDDLKSICGIPSASSAVVS
ncbi:hypothetical protein HPP92_021783 [Vanilla planifolia]|uniref:Uncharacterized protein n=1 Tax=Vanilla planifolia TaxID=51239 RepID=A0A835UJB4_VANPL|nr:hypothetical protein HPP92_021783 [Vanilla planifolia]